MTRIHYFTALAIVAAAPASAADFTFDVPVRVQNLPSVTTIEVGCGVLTSDTGSGRLIATGNSRVPVTGGNYEGTVTVEITNRGLIPSSEARYYSCDMGAMGTARTGARYSVNRTDFAASYLSITGHTVVRANNRVSGPIP